MYAHNLVRECSWEKLVRVWKKQDRDWEGDAKNVILDKV